MPKVLDPEKKANLKPHQVKLIDDLVYGGGCAEWSAYRAVVERGLTDNDIKWNGRLQRPLNFIETVDPNAEEARREAWRQEHGVTEDGV